MNYRRLFITNSLVFITVVTDKRRDILINYINQLRNAFTKAKKSYPFDIVSICILPNHFHMIIQPENIDDYPKIIKAIKTFFSKQIDLSHLNNYEITEKQKNRGEKNIWQKRYWEHTIRDEEDLHRHIDYIHYNPVKHGYESSVKNWKYSTFNKFVQDGFYEADWCNFGDKYNLKDMNLD